MLPARQGFAIIVFGVIYAAVIALTANSYHQLVLTVLPIWAVMGLAWNLLSGYSGFVSFGHAAFFGLGAYFVALTQIHWSLSPWLGIPGAGLIGALAGALIGWPTFRLHGHYFALAMLAYPLALLYGFEWLGYQELALPMRRDAPALYMQFADPRINGYVALALLLGSMLLTAVIERSRFGMSLMAIRQDETAAEAAGIAAPHCKLLAITISGALAGVAGGLYAVVLLVVTPPAVFGMLVSAQALIFAMLGGVGTVWGPVIGALLLVPLSELLQATLGVRFAGIQGVVYGVAILLVMLIAPEGIVWKLRDWRARRAAPRAPAVAPTRGAASWVAPDAHSAVIDAVQQRPIIFEVDAISKRFGGLLAVDQVSLHARRGEVLGIIGPNGAGKTTLFNVLNGFSAPSAGQVVLAGAPITGKTAFDRCRAGLGRTFQVVRPFKRMTVLDNVAVGAFQTEPSLAAARERARDVLEQVGLSDCAQRGADGLTSRELRLLELARALAARPKLLLLDETLAGLGSAEADEMIQLLRRLAASDLTIVIIEHTMQAMVRLVDRFVVLDHGAVLASGTPQEITRNPAVIDAYLGRNWRQADA